MCSCCSPFRIQNPKTAQHFANGLDSISHSQPLFPKPLSRLLGPSEQNEALEDALHDACSSALCSSAVRSRMCSIWGCTRVFDEAYAYLVRYPSMDILSLLHWSGTRRMASMHAVAHFKQGVFLPRDQRRGHRLTNSLLQEPPIHRGDTKDHGGADYGH